MVMRTLTSMTRTRFEEIQAGITDGSLTDRLADMDENNMTKRQWVELRQVSAIINIYRENPDLITWLVNEDWQEMKLIEKNNGQVEVRVKRRNPNVTQNRH